MPADDLYRACAEACLAVIGYIPGTDAYTALAAYRSGRPEFRAAIDLAVRAGRDRADCENYDRGYRVGYDIGYAEGRRHADAERADTCGTRDISCTCPTHGTAAPVQKAASGTTPPGEGDPVGAGASGAQRGAEAVELLPGCPVEVWDGPYLSRCSLGAKVLRCAYHGPFERAQRCRLDPACQRPVGHRGPCWPREADHGSAGAGTSGAQRGARTVAPGSDDFRCICDPNDPFEPPDPTPRAVAGCPAHRVRRVYQRWAEDQP